MLETIRKYTGSFVVKLLFVLLILSFGVWGVADVFRPGGGRDWAVRVGDVEIPPQTLRDDYQRELRRLRQAVGDGITDETARAFGLPNQVVSGVVARTLLDLESDRLGLVVGDDAVRRAIEADPTFHGPNGTFDAGVLRQVLQINGLSEDGFVRLVRGDMVRRMLIGSAAAGARVPDPVVEALYRHREERRTADYVLVPTAAVGDAGEPDEAQVKAFYEAHADRFSAPEYRSATAVILSAPAVAAGITVADAEIEEAYGARKSEFTEPERRTLEQVLVQDEATAQAAGERLRQGAEADAIATDLARQNASGGKLEKVSQSQLPRELGAAAFSLAEGEVSAPVKSPLGWHVLKVVAVEAGREKSLADVRDQIAKDLAAIKAVDEIYALSTRLEDALGGGASLEEAAKTLGLEVRRVEAIDAGGRDRAGAEVADLPEGFAQTVFATAEKSESVLTESGRDTFYVVRIDAVAPAGLKPLADVRNDVIAAWKAEQRAERAKARAAAVAEAARTGTLAAAAEAQGLSARTTPPFPRAAARPVEGVPPAIVDDVFAGKQGEVKLVTADAGTYVVRIASIVEADPKAHSEALAALRRELEGQAQEDALAQLSSGIRREFPVTMNQSVLEQVF